MPADARTHAFEPLDAAIGALPLLDEAGRSRPLQTLWSQGTAVIVFLRHFG